MKIKVALLAILTLFVLFACAKEEPTPEKTACEHVWSQDYSVRPPTEEEEGARIYSCIMCGEKKETPIPVLSDENYFIIKTEPTCEEDGSYVYLSDEWGEYEIAVPSLGHIFPSVPDETTATCTEAGEDVYVCKRCGEERREPKNSLGHDFAVYKHEGTCLYKGYTEYVCKRCDATYTANETDYAHDFVAGTYVPGSCTQKGYIPYVCRLCGATKKEEDDYVHHYNKDTGRCDDCGFCCEHVFVDYICSVCSFDIREELTDRSGVYTYEDRVYFGFYPQSHVADPDLIAELDEAFDSGSGEERTVGNFTYVRASVMERSNRVYSFSDGTSMSTVGTGREIHYFRYDPIVWRRAKNNVLIADCILEVGVYQYKNNFTSTGSLYFYNGAEGVYANDWSVSAMRGFLQNDFYEKAFTEKQRSMIVPVENDNVGSGFYPTSDERPWCDQESTTDTVFLAAYADLFGENDAYDKENADLTRRLSDYALCSNVKIDGGEDKTTRWLLRSPGLYSAQICSVEYDGKLSSTTPIYKEKTINDVTVVEKMAIVPAIKISMPE